MLVNFKIDSNTYQKMLLLLIKLYVIIVVPIKRSNRLSNKVQNLKSVCQNWEKSHLLSTPFKSENSVFFFISNHDNIISVSG